jgi:hypothetical protein
MLPANRLVNMRRRVNRARKFGENTCAASRHLQSLADDVASGRLWWAEDAADRENAAGSMYAVLESLWKLRTKLARMK